MTQSSTAQSKFNNYDVLELYYAAFPLSLEARNVGGPHNATDIQGVYIDAKTGALIIEFFSTPYMEASEANYRFLGQPKGPHLVNWQSLDFMIAEDKYLPGRENVAIALKARGVPFEPTHLLPCYGHIVTPAFVIAPDDIKTACHAIRIMPQLNLQRNRGGIDVASPRGLCRRVRDSLEQATQYKHISNSIPSELVEPEHLQKDEEHLKK